MQFLIVEDHPFVGQALGQTLTAGAGSIRSFDHVTHADAAYAHLRANRDYALIVLDLQLQESNGIDLLAKLRDLYPHIPALVFSADNTPEVIVRVYEEGARGYVHKSASTQEILAAVEVVLRGENYVSPAAATLLGLPATHTSAGKETVRRLSPRQEQILRRLLHGDPNKVISRELEIAVGTVKAHANAIYTMFGVHNRAQLVARAGRLSLYALLSKKE